MKNKHVVLVSGALICLGLTALATAAQITGMSGIGAVATTAKDNLAAIAEFVTAASYVAGMAFAVGAIVKFKAHKDNPTQVPISMPIVFLFVAIALIFAPTVFLRGGGTLFGASGIVGGTSGLTSFDTTS